MVKTMGRVALLPTASCPKARLPGVAVRSSLATPDPANQSWMLGFDVLPVKVTLALVHPVHPVAVGENITFTVTLAPAARVAGRVKPDTLNAEPLTLIAETVVLVDPVLVNTMSWVWVCPSGIAPNLSFEGVHTNCCVPPQAPNGSRARNAMRMAMETTRIGAG